MSETLYHVSANPHVRDNGSTQKIMLDVIIALLPATIFGIYIFGASAALTVAISVATCVVVEYIYQKLMKQPITVSDLSAALTGLLLALNLPPEAPFWMPILGGIFAIIVVKQVFGGLGQNFMNPALGARCFLMISFAARMTSFTYDGDNSNTTCCYGTGKSVDVMKSFLGFIPGTIGETSALLLIIGGVYLVFKKVISPIIPCVYVAVVAIFVLIFGGHGFDLSYMAAQIFSGGLMLGAIFMATDYVTSPITKNGKIIYAIVLGILTGLFRLFGPMAEGVSYSIIIANLLVPLIERVTVPTPFGIVKKEVRAMNKNLVMDCIKLCVITLIAGLLLGIVYNVTKAPIAAQEEKTKQEAYKAVFEDAAKFDTVKLDQKDVAAVLKKNDLGQNTISEVVKAVDKNGKELGYVFSVTNPEGYGGDVTLSVGVRDDGTVNGYETLSISETAGLGMKAKEPEFKSNFKNKKADRFEVVKDGSGKNDDSKVDAISGATITSRAVTSAVNSCVAYSKSLKGGN